MKRELEKFIRLYLDLEQAYDNDGSLRSTLHAFRSEYVDAVRTGLESVLATRRLSVADYEDISGIEFGSEEALYRYLGSMYRYLFEDGAEQPLPPDA